MPQKAFQLTRPLRGATSSSISSSSHFVFQLTRPLRGATRAGIHAAGIKSISTHTPLAGRDARVQCSQREDEDFNSHAPCGARRKDIRRSSRGNIFQLTRPLRGATRRASTLNRCSGFQLTRPLRGATAEHIQHPLFARISTHTPLAGRDLRQR